MNNPNGAGYRPEYEDVPVDFADEDESELALKDEDSEFEKKLLDEDRDYLLREVVRKVYEDND